MVIPTYNEAANVEAVLRRVLALDRFAVLVVDDGSPDGTGDIVRACKTRRRAGSG